MAKGWFKAAFLLLLSSAVSPARSAAASEDEPSVAEIAKNRIITGFKEGCDAERTAIRNLALAVKTAYGDMQKREGRTAEEAEECGSSVFKLFY